MIRTWFHPEYSNRSDPNKVSAGKGLELVLGLKCCETRVFPFSLVSSHSFHCCSTRCLPLRLPVFLSRKILGVRDPCSSLSAPCSAVRISSDMACRHVASGQTWDVFLLRKMRCLSMVAQKKYDSLQPLAWGGVKRVCTLWFRLF